MIDFKNVSIMVKKESLDSFKNRWFVLFTISFTALALFLFLISPSASAFGGVGFGRTTAGLLNLVLFFIPLVALVIGSISISGERENGTLEFLLSHPVSKAEVFIGKYLGLLFSIWVSIGLGFGLSGIVVALRGGGENYIVFLLTALLACILAASILSLGFLVSVFSNRASKAVGIAVFLWLVLIVFGDLGIIGTTVAMDLGIKPVFILALLNPTVVFKMASVIVLSSRFEVLGPVGVYAFRTFGHTGSLILFISVLCLWTLVPFLISAFAFTRLKVYR